jgi:hypothetical protein
MTVAAETRSAVRERPFLYDALRAGIVNYTAAARLLDLGETDAVAAALRRYSEELETPSPSERRASVSMRSGVGAIEDGEGLLSVGDATFGIGGGDHTAIVATGGFEATALGEILGRLRTADVGVVAAAGADGTAAAVVERRAGADAVRIVEDVL